MNRVWDEVNFLYADKHLSFLTATIFGGRGQDSYIAIEIAN